MRPQIYIYNTEGGLTNWDITRGDIDVVWMPWDAFDDNEPEPEDIKAYRQELTRIADPKLRKSQLTELDRLAARIAHWEKRRQTYHKAAQELKLQAARKTLRAAGELP